VSTIEQQIAQLTRAVQDLASQMSPWISTQEMCKRYDCTAKTLNAMERRGDIPWRVKGRWNRAEVIEWEARQAA
jgi:hypothetical protein